MAVLLAALCSCGRHGFDDVTTDVGGLGNGDPDANGSNDGGLEDAATVQGAWTPVTTASTTDFAAVWAFGANNIWIAGANAEIYQWNGTTWLDRSGGAQDVWTVWGATANDVWEAGPFCEVRRWNGTTWSSVTVPICGGAAITAIGGTAANDVWLVGYGGQAFRYNGTFTPLPQANNVDLNGLWAASASEAYFVGTRGAILHWNGSSVADEQIGMMVTLTAVWGSSPSDVWTVGAGGRIYRKVNNGVWTQVTSPTTQQLYAVWGRAANDVWAVGDAGAAIHYDGVSWQKVTMPTTASLRAIAGVPGGGIRIVGLGGTILQHP
jgi:hypothetical protein